MYQAELLFLKRKLPTLNVVWKPIEAMAQLVSPLYRQKIHAETLLSKLHGVLSPKAKEKFTQICFVANNANGFRVIVDVLKLREVFAAEIDGNSGGGGRGYRLIDPKVIELRRGRR